MMFAFGDKQWPGIAKVAEEFGETLQVIGRLMMMRGERAHWSGSDLADDLIDELADSKAAIEFVEMKVLTEANRARFNQRVEYKVHQFLTWHREQRVVDNGQPVATPAVQLCGGLLGSSDMTCALPNGHDGVCAAKARDDAELGYCGAPPNRPTAQQEHSAVLHAAGIPTEGCGGEHSEIMRAIGHG